MSVGKDRVFTLSEISELKSRYEALYRQAEEITTQFKQEINGIRGLASQVPSEAKSSVLASATSGVKMETAIFGQLITKLNRDASKLLNDLPQVDQAAGSNVKELTSATNQLKGVLDGYSGLIKTGFTSGSLEAFNKNLSKMRLKNGLARDAVDKQLKRVLETSKGLEVITAMYSKDPVNLATGNFSFEKNDLEITGASPLIFKRSYNAMDDYQGVLGQQWVHNFEVKLKREDNEISVMMEDGHLDFYQLEGEVYRSNTLQGNQLQLTESGYCLKLASNHVYHFNQDGMIVTITSPNSQDQTFSYNADKQLIKVTSSSGFIRFRYNQEGLLVTVRDSAKRKVSFSFDGNLLTQVTLIDGTTYIYTYDDQKRLTVNQSQRGIPLVKNKFDHLSRTTEQVFPDGGKMTYEYDDENNKIVLTEQNGNQITYLRDKQYRNVKTIYQDGEEISAYNLNDKRTSTIDKNGNKTQYAYDDRGNLTNITNALGEVTTLRYNDNNQPVRIKQGNGAIYQLSYDPLGNLLTMENPLEMTTKFQYNEQGLPIEAIQPDGSQQQFEYDERGNLVRLTLANGGQLSYNYDELNQVSQSIDALGNKTTYSYNKLGNISQVKNAEGNTRHYEYNEIQKVTKITDFDGYEICQDYNELGKVSSITDQGGAVTELVYDLMWNISKVKEANGAETLYLYNQLNQLAKVQNALGQVTTYSYDPNSNLTQVVNPAGETMIYKYDGLNRRVKVIEADGATTRISYNPLGKVSQVVDPLGNVQSFTYDLLGQLTNQINQLGHETTFTYTEVGNVATVTDPKGGVTSYNYYPGGKLRQVVKPAGETETYDYDLNGNLIKKTLGENLSVQYQYDCLNRVIGITNPTGAIRKFSYDGADQVTMLQDEEGHITEYYYSPTGQLMSVKDALGNKTQYDYDVAGNLTKIEQQGLIDSDLQEVQQLNRLTMYQYDSLGNVTKTIDALGNEESYEYNELNQLISKKDKDHYQTNFAYEMGKVKEIQYEDGKSVAFSYNPLRQLIEVQDWLGKTKIEVDSLGRPSRIEAPDEKAIQYQFDEVGNRSQLVYPDGKTVTYDYDSSNKLQKLTDASDSYGYEYDAIGRLIEKKMPNQLTTTYQYEQGYLSQLSHTQDQEIVEQHNYRYDKLGNKISIQKQRLGLDTLSGDYDYQYDALQRLVNVSKDQERVRDYSYDAFGNRLGKVEGKQATTYHYNELNQLIRQEEKGNTREYTYDKRGNRTEERINGSLSKSFTFDATNMMTNVVNQVGEEASYTYNGLRNRVGQQIQKQNEPLKQIQYVLDLTKPYNNMLERQVNQEKERYLWDNELLSQDQSAYFLLDELGSPLRQFDHQEDDWLNYGYDEFGQSLLDVKTAQPFGFTGYQEDEISGLNYAQARYFDQGQGRFVSEDFDQFIRIFESGTVNQYNYCQSNPVKYIDPMGFDLEEKYKPSVDDRDPIKVHVDGNKVTVDVYVEYKGDINGKLGESTYKELANEGISSWAGEYQGVFGNDVTVDVKIHEGTNPKWWEFWRWGEKQKYVPVNLKNNNKSFTENDIPHVTGTKQPGQGKLNMFTTDGRGTGHKYSKEEYVATMAHEFGHVFGLKDAYGDGGNRPDAFKLGVYEEDGIMRYQFNGIFISSKDIEMMILAAKDNEWQYFADYDGNKKSKALECIE